MQDTADDEHHCHHPRCSEEERFTAAELIDANEEEDGGCYDFDGSIDAGCEER